MNDQNDNLDLQADDVNLSDVMDDSASNNLQLSELKQTAVSQGEITAAY